MKKVCPVFVFSSQNHLLKSLEKVLFKLHLPTEITKKKKKSHCIFITVNFKHSISFFFFVVTWHEDLSSPTRG